MENTKPNYYRALSFIKDNSYKAYEISRKLEEIFGKGKGLTEVGIKKILDGDVDLPHSESRKKLIAFYVSENTSGIDKIEATKNPSDFTTEDYERIVNFIINNEPKLESVNAFRLWKENIMKDGAIEYLTRKLNETPS